MLYTIGLLIRSYAVIFIDLAPSQDFNPVQNGLINLFKFLNDSNIPLVTKSSSIYVYIKLVVFGEHSNYNFFNLLIFSDAKAVWCWT
jgi:hypothetical protein